MTRDWIFLRKSIPWACSILWLIATIIFFFLGNDWAFIARYFRCGIWWYPRQWVVCVLLKYFLYKRYLAAFVAGILVAISMILQTLVVFSINLLMDYYLPAAYLLVGASLIYCFTIMFSRAREKVWLKWAGGILLAACMLYVVIFILIGSSPQMLANGIVLTLSQWASLFGSLGPFAYIMNFLEEEKLLKQDQVEVSNSKLADSFRVIALVGAFIASTVFGFRLVAQSTRQGVITMQATRMSQQFEARTYVSPKGESMSYRLLRPLDYDSTRKYPLAVCLHGGAGWGTDNVKQFDGSLEAQVLYTLKTGRSIRVSLCPQCPRVRAGVDFRGFEMSSHLYLQY